VLASIELFELVTPPAVSGLSPGMYHYTNANVVRDIVVYNEIAYAATLGGMVAWNLLSGYAMHYTPLDGMSHVSANSVTVCQIPETRVIVGTLSGLSYYDPSTGLWEKRDLFPAGSSVNTSKINRVYCDQANQRLLIGYSGLGVLDLLTGEFERYTQKEGLAWGEVTDITVFGKDIYIASGYKGIARISSGQVTTYTLENGMPNERAHSIQAAKDGTIWVGASTGIMSFLGGKWTLYGSNTTANLANINEIEIADDGKIWAATSPLGTGRVCLFNPKSGACDVEYKDAEFQPILALALDENGYPVYGTGKGLYAYDGEHAKAFKTGEKLQTNYVDSFAVTSTGKLWVGTDGGVHVLDTADPSQIWDTYTKKTAPGMGGNWAKAIALGPDDTTWVAIINGEACRYQNGEWSTLTGLQSFNTIAVDNQGRAWFGDDGKGIVVLNSDGSSAMTFTVADGLPSDKIFALAIDDQDTVWIGTDIGLAKFERGALSVVLDKNNPRMINKHINNLVFAQDGSLIIGTLTGVMRLKGDQLETLIDFLKDGYSNARLTELAVAPNGRLWVGTNSGLLYSDNMISWTMLTTADGLLTNFISALAVDTYGAIWVGGGGSNFDGGGLLHIVP
jgi:ligand-binding sensor domain-containing protein